MNEKSLWTLLRSKLPMQMYRVENRIGRGMPDLHFVAEGSSGWIELKYLDKLPRDRISVGLKQHQARWLTEYTLEKGVAWILVRVNRSYLCLIHGRHAMKIFNRPNIVEFRKLVRWERSGNISQHDWEDLKRIIANG